MVKVKITFDLPEDRVEHLQAVHAPSMVSLIWDWTQRLRELDKYYETDQYSIEKIREEWCDMMSENGIDIDELTE